MFGIFQFVEKNQSNFGNSNLPQFKLEFSSNWDFEIQTVLPNSHSSIQNQVWALKDVL